VRFRATLLQHGRTATGIVVPAAVVEALGHGRRPPVRVTIGSHTWRSTVAVYGGEYLLGVSAANRAAAGIAAGDEIEIELTADTAPRTIEVPPDLAAALDADPAARAAFDALAYSHQRRHVEAIDQAKTAETRARRIARAVAMVTERSD
jgi:hypothetical protein